MTEIKNCQPPYEQKELQQGSISLKRYVSQATISLLRFITYLLYGACLGIQVHSKLLKYGGNSNLCLSFCTSELNIVDCWLGNPGLPKGFLFELLLLSFSFRFSLWASSFVFFSLFSSCSAILRNHFSSLYTFVTSKWIENGGESNNSSMRGVYTQKMYARFQLWVSTVCVGAKKYKALLLRCDTIYNGD